ncbi:MAG: fold metallo-hydrolase [Gammaproteobacteria bacterium]|nr:fold metallo-hydrolase [Gammaproteobacteria bacterium]
MPATVTRRILLNASLAGAVSLSVSALVPRDACGYARKDPIGSTRLGDDLWLFAGAGGNVVASAGPDGLLLVDGGAADRSAELLERVAAESGQRRVRTLFNTHWHWDHTGSNEALAKSGATIVAHENTRLWLGTEIASKWEGRTYPPRPARALPTRTFFYGSEQMAAGKQEVVYGYLPQAHTDGDIYLFFPKQNVLVAGGVVSGGGYPIADYCIGGWLGGMMSGLKILISKADAQTRIVPGAGPVRTRADLEAQLDMCCNVLARISESYYKGQTWQQLLESRPTRAFDEKWGNPDLFLKTAYEGAWLHINEIRRVTR